MIMNINYLWVEDLREKFVIAEPFPMSWTAVWEIIVINALCMCNKDLWMNRNEWITRFSSSYFFLRCFLKLFRSKVLDDVTENKWSELHFRYGRIWVFASQLSSIQLFSFVHLRGRSQNNDYQDFQRKLHVTSFEDRTLFRNSR